MVKKSLNFVKSKAKREKLTGFANWPVCSDITKSILIEKDVWDLVSTRPHSQYKNPEIWAKKVKKDRIAVGIVQRIIKKAVSD